MPRNVDGEIIVGIDIPASTKIVESDIQILLNKLTTLEAKINHAELTPVAKRELQNEINNLKNLTAYISDIELDDTAKKNLRNAVGKVDNLTVNIDNAKLDPDFHTNLQTELNKLSGLAINISNVNINQNAVNKQMQSIGKNVGKEIANQISLDFNQALNLDDTIDTEVQSMMRYFGVIGKKGSKAFNEIKDAVIKYKKVLATTSGDDWTDSIANGYAFDDIKEAVANNLKIKRQEKSEYEKLYNYVKNSNKIHIPDELRQSLGDDYTRERSKIGNFATNAKKYKLSKTDFETWINGINQDLGANTIDMSKGIEGAWDDLISKLNKAKSSMYLSAREILDSGIMDSSQIEKTILKSIDAINKAEQQQSQQVTQTTNTVVQQAKRQQQAQQQTAQQTKESVDSQEDAYRRSQRLAESQTGKNPKLTPNPSGYNAKNYTFEELSKNYALENVTFANTIDANKEAHTYFKQLIDDENAIIHTTQEIGQLGHLKSFTTHVKHATGEVESLRFVLDSVDDNDFFRFDGAKINDKGAIKQITAIENAIASYEQKVAQFKSTNEGILSGINFTNFDNALTALKNGTGSIDAVKIAYKDLGVQASNITKELSGQLSKAGTAVRNLAKGKETISGLRAEFKGLNDAPKDALRQLNGLDKKLKEINVLEQKNGRNADWAKAYREWQEEIDVLTAKLRVLQKEQSNAVASQPLSMSDLKKSDRAYISKVSNTVDKNSSEVQKMANAKGWTDWDITGIERADGMVKKLTVTFTDAEGAVKKFVMQRDKLISAKGNKYDGLVQVGDVQVIKSATTAEKELANTIGSRREQAEQSRKSEEKRLDVAQSQAQNKAIEEEYKNREKLAEAIAKGREQSELSRKAEEKKLSDTQNKAINKNIEQQAKDSAKKRAQAEESVNAELKIQRRTLSEIIILENQINNIDGNKEPEKLAYLKQQKKIKDDEYKISRQTMKSVAEEVMTEEELLALEQRRRKEMQEVASLARQAVSASNEQVTNKQAEKQTKKIKSIDDNVANNTYATQINDLITKYKQYGLTVDQAEDKVRELRSSLATMSNADKSAEERIKAEERYQQALKKSQNEVKVFSQNQRGLATDQQRLALANTMEAFLQKNTRITAKARQETEMYIATLRNLNSEMTVVAKNEINNSFKQMQNNMRVLGKLGYALKDQMKQATGSFVQWFSVSNLIMTGINHIRQIPTAVKEVNSAMIELNKVSSASSQEIANYFKDASYHAKDLGASISDVISATADWSRLGYNLPDSEELTKVALVYKNVGDGIDIDTATESLTSTLQGFQLEASEAMGVVDKFNEVKFVASFHSNMVACMLYT